MKKFFNSITPYFFKVTTGLIMMLVLSLNGEAQDFVTTHLSDGHHLLRVTTSAKYLLLPIQEKSNESQLRIISDNQEIERINVRLAVDKTDYFVPLDISRFSSKQLTILINNLPDGAVCWQQMQLSDTFDSANREAFRPSYHFTPAYGWMNDPNGMVYKDGIYHLYYQYNPYASVWGNMHWGHATSADLIHWKHQPIALYPDALGAIFSGSAIVDKDNVAGFGANAIIAFYASAGDRQTISMAYSNDEGTTFKKYTQNPVVTSNIADFRDPKVIYCEATSKWIMVVAAGQEMNFYSSSDLRNWKYESSFGKGEGSHDGVWECPDLMELNVEGTHSKKWVLLCNINPGGPFGGSATQYFVGNFDGKTFVNESPKLTKWMDYGKDHYATVSWSNAPQGRHIAIAWMSNWQYAGAVPTKQYRSGNSIARELSLFQENGTSYLKSTPVPEMLSIREAQVIKKSFTVNSSHLINQIMNRNDGKYEILLTIQNKNATTYGFELKNSKDEKVSFSFDALKKQFAMDRTKSGEVSFSKDFPCTTYAPTKAGNIHSLRIFVDKSSIEIFGDDNHFVMTNLVFPTEAYNQINFFAKAGSCNVKELKIYKLK